MVHSDIPLGRSAMKDAHEFLRVTQQKILYVDLYEDLQKEKNIHKYVNFLENNQGDEFQSAQLYQGNNS